MSLPEFSLTTTGTAPKVTTSQILENGVNAVISALYSEFAAGLAGLAPKGNWDASSGAFPSGAAVGDYYIVSVAGTVDAQGFEVGDWLVSIAANASTTTFVANWFRGDYSQINLRQFSSIGTMAGSLTLVPDAFYTVKSAFNGEPETFRYDASSTLTADGALIVDAVGMGDNPATRGRLVSTRTEFSSFAALLLDPRVHESGTQLKADGRLFEFAASGGAIDTAGGTVNEIGAVPSLQSDISSVSSSARGGVALTDPLAIVKNPVTLNLFNQNATDVATAGDASPALTTVANQLHRQRNNTSGALSAVLPAVVGSMAETRKIAVEGSTEYTISMHGAPGNFYFNFPLAQILAYDAAGAVLTPKITTLTRSFNDRQVTFTTTANTRLISFTVRNSTDFSNTNPMTEAALQACLDNIMLNEGDTALDFSPFSDGVFVPGADIFDPTSAKPIIAVKQLDDYYIRAAAQMSPDKDLVWQVRRNVVSGVTDFYGKRFIDKSTPAASTIAAFNTTTLRHSGGFDESCPFKYNGQYQGGGHFPIGRAVTSTGHNKDVTDLGSRWSDGVRTWQLYSISGDVLNFVALNTGTADKWFMSTAAITGSTLTHVSDAANTGDITVTSQVQGQFGPIIRRYTDELRVDDTVITADGVYSGARVVLPETYAIMNAASQQEYFNSVAGTEPDRDNDAISTQLQIMYEFEWNKWGAMSIRTAFSCKAAMKLFAASDYWGGGVQLQRLAYPGDSTGGMYDSTFLYVPDVPAAVSGYDFQGVADITANATEVRVPKSACADPTNPASHFAMIGKLSGTALGGTLYGYSRKKGLGVPATRAASVTDVMFFSNAEKNYPIAIDSGYGDIAAGDAFEVTSYIAPYLNTDADLTIPGVIVTCDGVDQLIMATHQTLTNKAVSLPDDINGRKITALKAHANVTVNDGYVSEGSISVSVASGYGDIVLELT